MKHLLWIIPLVVILAMHARQTKERTCQTVVTLPNDETLVAAVADTSAEHARGLSNRTTLPSGQGMLFLFPQPDIYPFWMKETRIALDIIWIKDHTVTEIVTLQPQTDTSIPSHTPATLADTVLEINAGQAAKTGIVPGSPLTWKVAC